MAGQLAEKVIAGGATSEVVGVIGGAGVDVDGAADAYRSVGSGAVVAGGVVRKGFWAAV